MERAMTVLEALAILEAAVLELPASLLNFQKCILGENYEECFCIEIIKFFIMLVLDKLEELILITQHVSNRC
jgi:hypothetical protein